jgi:osmotically-inducible protein OsmY
VGAKDVKSINYRWQVVNGVVYLIGRARTRRELDIVLAVIKDTRDVTRVVTHVEVGSPGQ